MDRNSYDSQPDQWGGVAFVDFWAPSIYPELIFLIISFVFLPRTQLNFPSLEPDHTVRRAATSNLFGFLALQLAFTGDIGIAPLTALLLPSLFLGMGAARTIRQHLERVAVDDPADPTLQEIANIIVYSTTGFFVVLGRSIATLVSLHPGGMGSKIDLAVTLGLRELKVKAVLIDIHRNGLSDRWLAPIDLTIVFATTLYICFAALVLSVAEALKE